ncbi:arylsulfotransferase family protein [Gammaproteobacteria bacterium]|nr:arylsulfotransferase family protein [Gammaproteobacteria bacterium]
MFKKIEVWILYLAILLGILFSIFFGILVRQELVGSTKLGPISKSALFLAEVPKNTKAFFLNPSQLNFLRFEGIQGFQGAPNTEEKYFLLSRFDGAIQEGIVELIDLRTFEVLHTWNPDFDSLNMQSDIDGKYHLKNLQRDFHNGRARLFHPLLLANGELIFTFPLRKIDSCSNLILQNDNHIFHHSIEMDHEGNFWLPSKIYPSRFSEIVGNKHSQDGGYHDDALSLISNDGEIKYQKSVTEIFVENNMEHLIFANASDKFKNNPLHLNDIQPVNIDGDFFKKGDIFFSLRHQSMIVLFRPSTNKILWKSSGQFFFQHDIDVIDDSRISLFNNNVKNFYNGQKVHGNNEVLIYNFKNNSYKSYLSESLQAEDVKTLTGGLHTILENNDLFIEESDFGRFIYFNSNGTLRWQYVNRWQDQVYRVAWSRVIDKESDVEMVNHFLDSRNECK